MPDRIRGHFSRGTQSTENEENRQRTLARGKFPRKASGADSYRNSYFLPPHPSRCGRTLLSSHALSPGMQSLHSSNNVTPNKAFLVCPRGWRLLPRLCSLKTMLYLAVTLTVLGSRAAWIGTPTPTIPRFGHPEESWKSRFSCTSARRKISASAVVHSRTDITTTFRRCLVSSVISVAADVVERDAVAS